MIAMSRRTPEELVDQFLWVAQQEVERFALSRKSRPTEQDYLAAYHGLSRAATGYCQACTFEIEFEPIAREAIVGKLKSPGLLVGSALPHEADELVESHLWLAEEEAKKHVRLRRLVGDDEVLSTAYYALTRAAYNFRLERQGVDGFEAYARKSMYNRFKDSASVIGSKCWVNFSALGHDDGGDSSDDGGGFGETCHIEDRLPPVVGARDSREDEAEANRASDAADAIDRGLAEIGEPYATALRLQFGIGCEPCRNTAEIAKAMKIPKTKLSSVLAEGRERLKEAIASLQLSV